MELEKNLSDCLKRAIDRHENMGSSVMVRKNRREVLYVAEGYADADKKTPVLRDSIFRMYSQTKIITSIATMILVDRGILDMWEPVSNYIPTFKGQKVITPQGLVNAKREVRIKDLLGMTAGVSYPNDADTAGKNAKVLFDELRERVRTSNPMTTMELCSRIGELPLAFQPGEQFRYSTCADVLGGVIEAATGDKFEDFLSEEIFEPLEMKDTAFFVPPEKRSRLVTAYIQKGDTMVPYYDNYDLGVSDPDTQPAYSAGGAGLLSTTNDYAAVADMMLNMGEYNGRRILSKQAVMQMTSSQLNNVNKNTFWEDLRGFGYGYIMRQSEEPGKAMCFTRKGEYGWDGRMGVHFANYPAEGISVLFMENRMATKHNSIARQVKTLVLSAESNGEF